MPRRRGFLARLGGFLRNLVAPAPPRRERERERGAPPRERDRERDRRREARERERPFRDTWQDYGQGQPRARYQGHRDIFNTIPGIQQEDEDEQLDLWDSYVRNMIVGDHPYRFNDIRNPFWADARMQPRDFDWAAWRELYRHSR